jgi:RNA polymerase sigma-70 factor (ECF subfamily)
MDSARGRAEQLFRDQAGSIHATLIRLLGDFDLAGEVMQEAFVAALSVWADRGLPDNPRAWLIATARNRAIDQLRRRRRFLDSEDSAKALADLDDAGAQIDRELSEPIADDQLRLIFTCCHPALTLEAQVALTLHTLCGLTTEQVARAFLLPLPTLAQRLVRARKKIRDAGIPYRVPPPELLPERLAGVLAATYLVFNEGYLSASAEGPIRAELCSEAIRLARLVSALLPTETEPRALLALLLLHDSRRRARVSPAGELVLLEDQDRSLWDRAQIEEALAIVEEVLRQGGPRPFALQAAIAALHARARRAADTDWRQIAALYGVLIRVQPTPVIELNFAAAISMVDGPDAALRLMDALAARGQLENYHLLHAARGDCLRRAGRTAEAREAYQRALESNVSDVERRFLSRRVNEL